MLRPVVETVCQYRHGFKFVEFLVDAGELFPRISKVQPAHALEHRTIGMEMVLHKRGDHAQFIGVS